jgi:LPPG:FO 2-phospho-L-lactate transferase
MRIVALAGGIGAGKFLRGLVRAAPARDITAIINTGDDIVMHGLHISPDLDSVTYWLGNAFDRERGWGRRDETFRATEELRRFDENAAWFGLGDLDLATHLYRTRLLHAGSTLSEATALIAARFGVTSHLLPMSDDPISTRLDVVSSGRERDLHFQEYWVRDRARGEVKGIRFEGVDRAAPAPGVLEAIAAADLAVICPSNPVVSVGPILAVPGIRDAIGGRGCPVVGVSPIVDGAPLAGMADRLMPGAGLEVSALGAGRAYRGLLTGWVIDNRDASLAPAIERELGVRVAVTDTIMRHDAVATDLAHVVVGLAS